VRVAPTELPGVVIIEPDVYRDARGHFLETYHVEKYRALGISAAFVQDNYSSSIAGTVRGLHVQVGRPQAKLIRVLRGTVFDVAVDVRRGSPTFGRWVAITLQADDFRQCFIPRGFAHGFAALSEEAEVEYKCSDVYDPATEVGIAWNDQTLGISWPVTRPLLSPKDRSNPPLDAVLERLPLYDPTDL
jgi:dTDP-4-dehydrorhamnose 3,5-epimerase